MQKNFNSLQVVVKRIYYNILFVALHVPGPIAVEGFVSIAFVPLCFLVRIDALIGGALSPSNRELEAPWFDFSEALLPLATS